MKKITAYQTEDERVFEDRISALAHEFQLRQNASIEKFWSLYGYSGMTAHDAAVLCLENIDQLEEALKGKLCVNGR